MNKYSQGNSGNGDNDGGDYQNNEQQQQQPNWQLYSEYSTKRKNIQYLEITF